MEFGASSAYESTAARNDATPFNNQPLAAGFHPSDEVGAGAAFEEVAGYRPEALREVVCGPTSACTRTRSGPTGRPERPSSFYFLGTKENRLCKLFILKMIIWCREGGSNPHDLAVGGF